MYNGLEDGLIVQGEQGIVFRRWATYTDPRKVYTAEIQDETLEKGGIQTNDRHKILLGFMSKNAGLADLDRVRNEWISALYDIRNLVIHRSGLDFISNFITGSDKFSISGGSKEQKILRQYLCKIGITDPIQNIDLTLMSKHQWQKLSELIENVVKKSRDPISASLINKRSSLLGSLT